MKNFEYAAPRTEDEVLELLRESPGRTEILAGGTDLVGLMKKMIVTPERVVNIMEVTSLQQIEALPDGSVAIGAVVTLDEILESSLLRDYSALHQAIEGISSMQLQAQGTLGGEICQRARCWYFRNGHGLLAKSDRIPVDGDDRFHAILGNAGPAKFVNGSRTAPALIALGARVRVAQSDSEIERWIPLEDFFRTPRHEGQRETVLEPGQLVTHIVLPPAGQISSATYEVRHGEGPDYPLVSAAASLDVQSGVVRQANVVLGQVAPIPWISAAAAKRLVGARVDPAAADAAGKAAVETATPLNHNQYKVDLAQVAVKRAILRAAGLETGGF